MKRGKSLPLARVSERKFRFECRRGAKRERERERGVWGKKSWKKNRYLSTDSARGKEFEKGNFA